MFQTNSLTINKLALIFTRGALAALLEDDENVKNAMILQIIQGDLHVYLTMYYDMKNFVL
jgi:hypothetical protein